MLASLTLFFIFLFSVFSIFSRWKTHLSEICGPCAWLWKAWKGFISVSMQILGQVDKSKRIMSSSHPSCKDVQLQRCRWGDIYWGHITRHIFKALFHEVVSKASRSEQFIVHVLSFVIMLLPRGWTCIFLTLWVQKETRCCSLFNICTHDTVPGSLETSGCGEDFFQQRSKDNPLIQEQRRRKRLSVLTAASRD